MPPSQSELGNIITSAATGTNLTPSGMIWTAWNTSYTAISTINTATANLATTQIITPSGVIWTAWNQSYSAINTANLNTLHVGQQLVPRTPEQVQQDLQRNEQYRQRQIVVEAERAKARERAAKLLQETLTPKQREELAAKGHFTLETIAPTGERRVYRISRGRSHNIARVDDNGKILKTICAHPIEAVPDEDTMLAQKLWLETREEEFLRIANHSVR